MVANQLVELLSDILKEKTLKIGKERAGRIVELFASRLSSCMESNEVVSQPKITAEEIAERTKPTMPDYLEKFKVGKTSKRVVTMLGGDGATMQNPLGKD